MQLLNNTISTDRKSAIVGPLNPTPVNMPPLTIGDIVLGQLAIVQETGDANNPTTPFLGITGLSVALTDGVSLIYAQADEPGIEDNILTFNLDLSPDNIPVLAALLLLSLAGFVDVFIEIKIQTATQELLIIKEQIPFQTSASAPIITP